MWYIKNKTFQKDLKNHSLDDEDLKEVISDILKGRGIPLGSKIYKIRGASEGKGKRGGFRTLFFWKKHELIVFCLLFGKNEQDNLSPDDKKVLEILSREYDNLTEDEIKERIGRLTFKEIRYEKQ